jgi:hypothetical protein
MIARVLVSAVVSLSLFAISAEAGRQWNPSTAANDAERDIAAQRIRFAYIGGYASHAPGLPKDGQTWLYVLRRYPRLEVGPQGCDQDDLLPRRSEYARRYNQQMWSYVSKHR